MFDGSIHRSGKRSRFFRPTVRRAGALDIDEALATAAEVGYPVMVRPIYVLGGRAMRVVYDDDGLRRYFEEARSDSGEHPVLIDQFLEDAVEFDVDAVCDGSDVMIGGIMQHIEETGIHTRRIALKLGVVGLMNIQFANHQGKIHVLEINPRRGRPDGHQHTFGKTEPL